MIAITPDGTRAYSGDTQNNVVLVINTSSNTVIASIPVGTLPVAIGAVIPQSPAPPPPPPPPAPTISAPTNLKGVQKRSSFLVDTDRINVLTWSAPTTGDVPVKYNIYRDSLSKLIATVSATGSLQYQDHNRKRGQVYTYFVVSVDSDGSTSSPATITVTP